MLKKLFLVSGIIGLIYFYSKKHFKKDKKECELSEEGRELLNNEHYKRVVNSSPSWINKEISTEELVEERLRRYSDINEKSWW